MKITQLYQESSVMKFIRNGKRARSQHKKKHQKTQNEIKNMKNFYENFGQNHTPWSRVELATTFLCRQKSRDKLAKKRNLSIFTTFFDKLKQYTKRST